MLALVFASTFTTARAEPAPAAGVVKDAITGSMTINFSSRTNKDTTGSLKEGSPAKGATDVYYTDLLINQFVRFNGQIIRQPNLYSKTLHRRVQDAQLHYDLTIGVVNPKNPDQKKNIGKWTGLVPINTETGAYELAGGAKSDSPLRFDVESAGAIHAYRDNFGGELVGKAEKKDTLAAYTYKRVLPNGKEADVVVKRSDPMRFDNIVLPHGPSDNYPRVTVSGRLDYDYETGNYYTDGIKLAYNLDGKDVADTITGSIKWIEDADRKTSGKGHYEFNLRWNEDKNKSTEASAFESVKQEDAFFVVDNSVPSLTGTIEYIDTGDMNAPSQSKVTYHLDANRLEKHQIMAFAKLWLVAVGPTNDE